MNASGMLGVFAVALGLTLAPTNPTEKPRKLPEAPAHEVTLEIYALRSLYYFRFTRDQLIELRKLAAETTAKTREHGKCKASEDYRTLLGELRNALAAASDPDRIDDLEDKLADLHEAEQPEIDDVTEITSAARKRTQDVFRWLKPAQLASYYGLLSEDVTDPGDELVSNLEAIRGMSEAEWKDHRDTVAAEVAWLAAGLDDRKHERIAEGVVRLLTTARESKDEEFAAKKAGLEKRARKLVGDIDPGEVLRNHTLHALADLLSNSRLHAAIEARLKPEK